MAERGITLAEESFQHSTGLFLQLSSCARYLLDKVLSAENCDYPKNLQEECDALDISLQAFRLRKKKVLLEDLASTTTKNPDNVLEQMVQNKQSVSKFPDFCEKVRKKLISLSDLSDTKPYYCKICDVASMHERVFNEHSSSKKHIKQINSNCRPLAVYKCKACNLFLLANESEVGGILSDPEHRLLDEHISKLKSVPFKDQIKSIIDSEIPREPEVEQVSGTNLPRWNSTDNINLEINGARIDVNYLFHTINKHSKSTSYTSKKLIPHYCCVCEFLSPSVNNFIEHSSSKEHITAVNNATEPIHVFKCEKCGFFLTGFQDVINELMNSESHLKFDEYASSCMKGSEKISVSSSNGLTKFNSTLQKEVSAETDGRSNLRQSIASLLQNAKSRAYIQKYAPGYCYPCNKVSLSSNDFGQHVKSKKHKAIVVLPSGVDFSSYNCLTCSLSLFGTACDINNFLESTEHISLHKKMDSFDYNEEQISKPLPLFNETKSDSELNTYHSLSDKLSLKMIDVGDGASNLLSGNSSSSIKSNQDDNLVQSNAAAAKPLNHRVPDKFLTINSKLQCGNFIKSGFCRPCKRGVNVNKGWNAHFTCSKHKKATEKLQCENIPVSCSHCPLQILGDQLFGNYCMDLHLTLNHPNIETSLNNQEVAAISNLDLRSSSTLSKENSATLEAKENHYEVEYLHLVDEIKKLSFDDKTKSQAHLFEPNTGECSSTIPKEQVPKEINERILKSILFSHFLNKRKQEYLNLGLKQFGGMCLLCTQTFENIRDWLVHLKQPNHSVTKDVIERECKVCNLFLFGLRSDIYSEFWFHPRHVDLDSLMAI